MYFLLVVTTATAHSTAPLGSITRIGYTSNGELLGVTDPSGKFVVNYGYNAVA